MTVEEILLELEKNSEAKTKVINSLKEGFIESLSSTHVVRTKADDEAHLASHVSLKAKEFGDKAYKEKFDSEFSATMNKIDAEISAVTGIEKKPGEKTTEYAKRAVSETKGAGSPQVEELQRLIKTTKEDYEKQLTAVNETFFKREIELSVGQALEGAQIAVPAHLKTDEERQGYVNQQKNLIKAGFLGSYNPKKDENGNIIFYDGEKPLMSTKDGKPLGASELMADKFGAWFVPKGAKQEGAGTGRTGASRPEGGFKDLGDIHGYLKSNGVVAGSKEYMDKLSSLAEESKIEI